MALWEAMAKAFNKDTTLAEISSEQGEAIIDALALVLFADGKASFLEMTELEHLLHEMPWTHNNADVDAYTKASTKRAEKVNSDDEIKSYVGTIASRLGDTGVREKAYEMAARMAHADWQINPGERNVLDGLAAGLGIDEARAKALFDKVADETM